MEFYTFKSGKRIGRRQTYCVVCLKAARARHIKTWRDRHKEESRIWIMERRDAERDLVDTARALMEYFVKHPAPHEIGFTLDKMRLAASHYPLEWRDQPGDRKKKQL